MDHHYLSPLFNPRSLVVLAGPQRGAQSALSAQSAFPTREAALLRRALAGGGDGGNESNGGYSSFAGPVTWLDLGTDALAGMPSSTSGTTGKTGTVGSLADLAQSRADLALIALPADQLLTALDVVGRIRCRAALIVTGGVAPALCTQLHQAARQHGVQLLGPNSLGLQRPGLNLNASVLGPMAAAGPLALVSQSGALTAAMLDWARSQNVGFSAVVTLGPNTALELPQVLDFLATDGRTQSVLVYMEGIHQARRFMSALRAAAYAKPVVVMKAGRQPAGSTVALTHSAAIVGHDDVFDAALRRAGAVRVRQFTQLFSAAQCLASRFRPVGTRLAIISNGGGPAVLAADWAGSLSLQVAHVADLGEDADGAAYLQAMQAAVQDRGVDGVLLLHAPKASAAFDPAQPGDNPAEAIARAVAAAFSPAAKPVLGCWLGEATVRGARALLAACKMPVFRTPEAAVDAFNSIASFYRNQQLLQQTPPPLAGGPEPDTEGARLLIEGVLAERRQVLTEMESKALLAAFHIPVTRTMLARSATEAMLIATQHGFPVALKIDSPDIAHKTDVQGVVLNVHTTAQVRDRYHELLAAVQRAAPQARINGVTVQPMAAAARHGHGREVYVGLTTDEAFGPVITFGAGGTMIELIADRAMELPPLNRFLAHKLIERARVAELLGPWRGAPAANAAALEQLLLRVSEMVCALPQLREMDINPVIVDDLGAVAVDARIVVADAGQGGGHAGGPGGDRGGDRGGGLGGGLGGALGAGRGAYSHLAILPYPTGQAREWQLLGGGLATLRPIHPGDADMLQALVRGLSPESRFFRFNSSLPELPLRMLARFTLIDYDREMALVAVVDTPAAESATAAATAGATTGATAGAMTSPTTGATTGTTTGTTTGATAAQRIVGVSRIVANPDGTSCEFALLVADDFTGRGLGSRLMLAIIDVARSKGLAEIMGLVLVNNAPMLRLVGHLGFSVEPYPDDRDFKLVRKGL